jgi:hypothetical protein
MAEAKAEIETHLATLDMHLIGKTYLVAEQVSLAEVCYAPFLQFLPLMEITPPPAVARWSERRVASTAVTDMGGKVAKKLGDGLIVAHEKAQTPAEPGTVVVTHDAISRTPVSVIAAAFLAAWVSDLLIPASASDAGLLGGS